MSELNIHAIWLGKILPDKYLANIIEWQKLNPNAIFTLWIDSRIIIGSKSNIDKFYSKLQINNINCSDIDTIFKLIPDSSIKSLIDLVYNTEIGLYKRSFYITSDVQFCLNKRKNNRFKNYGMATDILRLLILKYYNGLYIDVDLEPTYISAIISKNINNTNHLYVMSNIAYSNSLLYFNNSDHIKINNVIEFILNHIITYLYRDYKRYIRYLTTSVDFKELTVSLSGPRVYDLIDQQFKDNPVIIPLNSWIDEKQSLKEHTWVGNNTLFLNNKKIILNRKDFLPNIKNWDCLETNFKTYLQGDDVAETEWNKNTIKQRFEWIEFYENEA